jgi:hypothetical protein
MGKTLRATAPQSKPAGTSLSGDWCQTERACEWALIERLLHQE